MHAMNTQTNSTAGRATAKVMNRSDLTRRLVAKLKQEEAVVGGIGHTHFDLWAAGQRPQNFYMLGSMGLAAPIAMGVALAQPARKVIALEGDGSLLMQLGTLGTIAQVAPKNLIVIVWDNGAYQITGSQPTLTAAGVDLVAVAKGSGLAQSVWAADEAHFEKLVDQALASDGPTFICARTDDQPPAGVTERDAAKIRTRFMEGLKVSTRGNQQTYDGVA
jgi:thiamine pyrophosphate-dependent acetolactate synthase large subunit-like protein